MNGIMYIQIFTKTIINCRNCQIKIEIRNNILDKIF